MVPVSKDGNYVWISILSHSDGNKSIAYYKRVYRGNHKGNCYRFYKKYANRVVRRYKGELHSGGSYKKCFDYWWTVD